MDVKRAVLWSVLLVCPSLVSAQSYTGTIAGAVTDSSGAVVPGATVTITNQQTDHKDTVITGADGRFTSLPLPPGEYRVDVGLQGFRRAARPNVVVQIGSAVTVDLRMEVGQLTDEVEVNATAPLLETTNGTIGKVVDNKRILELPLNTRNVYSLIFLTPGVAGSIGNNYNSM